MLCFVFCLRGEIDFYLSTSAIFFSKQPCIILSIWPNYMFHCEIERIHGFFFVRVHMRLCGIYHFNRDWMVAMLIIPSKLIQNHLKIIMFSFNSIALCKNTWKKNATQRREPSIRSNITSDINISIYVILLFFVWTGGSFPPFESALVSQRYYFFCILFCNNDFIFQLCLCGAVWQWHFVWYLRNFEDKHSCVCHQPTNNSEREKNTRDSKKSTATRRQK